MVLDKPLHIMYMFLQLKTLCNIMMYTFKNFTQPFKNITAFWVATHILGNFELEYYILKRKLLIHVVII